MTTPKRPAVTRWTSAKRPPKDDRDVQVFVSFDETVMVGYHDARDVWFVYGLGLTTDVSHWRPLPPPPRVRAKR